MGSYRSIIVLALAGTLISGATGSVALSQISGIDHYRARLGYQNQPQQSPPQQRPVQQRPVQQRPPQQRPPQQRPPQQRPVQQRTERDSNPQQQRLRQPQPQRQPTARPRPQQRPQISQQRYVQPANRTGSAVRRANHQLPVRTNSNPFQADGNSRFTRPQNGFSLPSQKSRPDWSKPVRNSRGTSSRGATISTVPTRARSSSFGRPARQQQIDDIFGEQQVPGQGEGRDVFDTGQVPKKPLAQPRGRGRQDIFGEDQVPTKPPAQSPARGGQDHFGEGQVKPPVTDTIPTLPDVPVPNTTQDPPKDPRIPDTGEPIEQGGVVLPPNALEEPNFLDNKGEMPGIIPDQKVPRPGSIFDPKSNPQETDTPESNDGGDARDETDAPDAERGTRKFDPNVYDPADPRHPTANNGPESWYRPGNQRPLAPLPGEYNPNLYGANVAPPYPGYAPGYPGYAQQYPGYPPQAGYPPQYPGYAPPYPGYPPQQPAYPPQQLGYPPQHPSYPTAQTPPGYAPPANSYPVAGAGVYSPPSTSGLGIASAVGGSVANAGCPDGCSVGHGNGIVNGFLESTFYLSLFGGYTNLAPVTISDPTGDFRLDATDGYGLGAALGQYQGLNLRTEIEFSFRENELTSITSPGDSTFVPPAFENADVRSFSGMANAIWEFVEFRSARVKPYVGAGFGFVNVEAEATVAGVDAFAGIDDSDSSFAFQVIGGLNFRVNETVDIFGEYRYLKADSLQLGNFGFDYETSNVFGGLRVKF